MKSARNSSRMLEEATATRTTILAKYTEQRDHLKNISMMVKHLLWLI
ncbi:hypothetical protein HanRHA438_Chr16g0741711 [Helianthus annuus]|nr:hypothetical protein HanRHA438_Chr16g0741711 [Helianthus annuus]